MESNVNNQYFAYDGNYSGADIGDNPSVNLATGRLAYAFADLVIGQGRCATGVSHIYSSIPHKTLTSRETYVGSGWKLNLHQYLTVGETNADNNAIIRYVDEGGEIHKFVQFDGSRYYDERNAQTVLDYSTKCIADGVGNKLYFDELGRLVKSVSCDTTPTIKQFVYESDKLVKVFYTHAEGAATNRRIELEYNSDLLSAMTVYSKSNRKQYGLVYKYDGNMLVDVQKVTFNSSSQVCSTLPVWRFEYDSTGLLVKVVNGENNSATAIEYDDSTVKRASKVHVGIVREDGSALGAVDVDGQSVVNCGALQCGALVLQNFEAKSYKSFSYNKLSPTDEISYETDVTNEKGITIAYFVNRDSRIVSSFEKIGDDLFTLNVQGERRTNVFGEKSTGAVGPYINEYGSVNSVDGEVYLFRNETIDVARTKADRKQKFYEYSFWLKLNEEYEDLLAGVTFSNGAIFKIRVDGKAQGVWQRVSVPFQLGVDKNNEIVTNIPLSLRIRLYKNGSNTSGSFTVNEIGFAPASRSDMLLATENGSYEKLSTATSVAVNATIYQLNTYTDTPLYFTENDVIASCTNKFLRTVSGKFEVVCNNGTKRIGNVTNLEWRYANGNATSIANTTPIKVRAQFGDGSRTIYSNYTYSATTLTVKNEAYEGSTFKSSTQAVINSKGQTTSEMDEYGVRTNYRYDSYGNLDRREVVGSDGVVASVQTCSYDADGKLTSATNGLTGQDVSYDDNDRVAKSQPKVFDTDKNAYTASASTVENRYGIFSDNVTEVSEYASDMGTARNRITYENGRIRTVSDATSKYGMKFDPHKDIVEYTRFDGAKEKLVQRDQVTKNIYGTETHKSTFFDNDGAETAVVSTIVNKYGNITELSRTDSTINTYWFTGSHQSQFAALQGGKKDEANNTHTQYDYDPDGNLTSWIEWSYNEEKKLRAIKCYDGLMLYYFNDLEDYYTTEVFDKDKLMSPRVTSMQISYLNRQKHNSPVTEVAQDYQYDGLGRIDKKSQTTTRYDWSKKILESKSNFNYEYTSIGQTSALKTNSIQNEYHYGAGSIQSNVSFNYGYTRNGLLKSIKKDFSQVDTGDTQHTSVSESTQASVNYDKLQRIISETNSALGINRRYTYDDNGRISTVRGSTTKDFKYDANGRLQSITGVAYTYDNYGNRIRRIGNSVTDYVYENGSMLTQVGNDVRYKYNSDNVRFAKVVGDSSTYFYLDGSKVLGEDRGSRRLRYLYDEQGLSHFKDNDTIYCYVRDVLGNVVMILSDTSRIVARYEYDIWGNCKVMDMEGVERTEKDFIGNVNPFRWKGFYYDVETGLYYANGSYYDPETGTYLDATPIATAIDNAFTLRCLDRNGLLCNNVLELAGNPFTVSTTVEMFAYPNYEPPQTLFEKIASLFAKIPRRTKIILGVIFFAAAILLTAATYGSWLAAVHVLVQVAFGVVAGVGVWAIGVLTSDGEFTWDGFYQAAIDSFLISSFFAFVSAYVDFVKMTARGTPYPQTELMQCSQTKSLHDGVEIQYANKFDFTSEAWNRIENLPKRADGSTISNLRDGLAIHKGYKFGLVGKEYTLPGYGRIDYLDLCGKAIYELKPNNAASIARGITQLHRYSAGLGGGYSLVLVLY